MSGAGGFFSAFGDIMKSSPSIKKINRINENESLQTDIYGRSGNNLQGLAGGSSAPATKSNGGYVDSAKGIMDLATMLGSLFKQGQDTSPTEPQTFDNPVGGLKKNKPSLGVDTDLSSLNDYDYGQ